MSLSISIYFLQNVTMSAGGFRLCPFAPSVDIRFESNFSFAAGAPMKIASYSD